MPLCPSCSSNGCALAAAAAFALAGCQASVVLPPSEVPAVTNAEGSGQFPVIKTESGKRQEVYGFVEGLAIERKGSMPLYFPAPIRTAVNDRSLLIRTQAFVSEVPLAEIARVRVDYDDYLMRDKIAGGVLLGMGGATLVMGVSMATFGLTEDPGGGIGPTVSLSGLAVSGIGLMMMMPGMRILKTKRELPAAEIKPFPGGAAVRATF